MDRLRAYSSKRSIASESLSESQSEVGSLLSGLSQARKIPDRRLQKENGRGGMRSRPQSSNGVNSRPPRNIKLKPKNASYKNEMPKIIQLQALARGYILRFSRQSRLTMEKTKQRFFAMQLQAFIRGFLQRQRYRKMTGKRRVHRKVPKHPNTDRTGLGSPRQTRIGTRAPRRIAPKPPNVVGVPMGSDSERSAVSMRLQRLVSHRPTERDEMGESESDAASIMSNLSRLSQARKVPDRRRKQAADEMGESESDAGSVMSNLSRLSQARRIPDRRKHAADELGESESDAASIMSNLSRLSVAQKLPDRRRKHAADELGESESDAASIMSNLSRLSVARKVPDRRRKHAEEDMGESESDAVSVMSNLSTAQRVPDRRRRRQEKKDKAVKIQALARGYIQRFLYRSMMAMVNTKKKYAAITIEAYVRGFLQRKNGPEVSRVHVTPRREPPPAPCPSRNAPPNNSEAHRKRSNPKVSRREAAHNERPRKRTLAPHNPRKTMRKPVRHRSDSDDNMLPRELTIRKPRRHTSDSGEESHDLPVKHLTIRMPRRHRSESDGSDNEAPKRVTVNAASGMINMSRNKGRGNSDINKALSPPRKVMLRVKKGRRPEIDMDKSEESLEQDNAHMGRSHASERFGESESEVGSLMSGLSQARKVPDRRLKRKVPSRSAPKGDKKINKEEQLERAKSATKIQAIGRGYTARFAYKSRLTLERTKKRFFAVQIQAVARGYINRSKQSK